MDMGRLMKVKRLKMIVCMVLLVGIAGVWIEHQLRQTALNDALLTAIKSGNTQAALAALQAGANPNARDTSYLPVDSSWQRLLLALGWYGRLPTYQPTALYLA